MASGMITSDDLKSMTFTTEDGKNPFAIVMARMLETWAKESMKASEISQEVTVASA